MSKYYNPKRTRNLYDPSSEKPFKISRSKIDLFLNCPKCFYLDRKLGVAQPPGYPFSLNSAVDELLKKEFDFHREKGTIHPLALENGVNAKPFVHDELENWRNSLHYGIQYLDKRTNLLITGGVDDVWIDNEGKLIIVDYKATSKKQQVDLEQDWQIGYKRQMEVYQWLFRKNGFDVSDIGYFVYCNGITDKDFFDSKLEFDISLLPYEGNDDWVDKTILDIYECLNSEIISKSGKDCDFCAYREVVKEME